MGGNYQQLRDWNKFLDDRRQVEAWPCQKCCRDIQSPVGPRRGADLPSRTLESHLTKAVSPSQSRNVVLKAGMFFFFFYFDFFFI